MAKWFNRVRLAEFRTGNLYAICRLLAQNRAGELAVEKE
jgi:hypothetical protein